MNTSVVAPARRLLRLALFILALCIFASSAARAGLTFQLYFYVSDGNYVFYTPLSSVAGPVRTWATVVNLDSEAFSAFVVGAPARLPVTITNSHPAGANLLFTFLTQAGRPHTIQSRTNLSTGAWIDLSNFVGDGSLRQFTFPTTNNPPNKFFRVKTQ